MPAPLPSIGIDLGTTNSAVATAAGGKVRLIERVTGQRLMPSMVGITPTGENVVGEAAHQLADSFPEYVAYGTKRFIGQRWTQELAIKNRTVYPFPLVSGPTEDVRVRLGERSLPVTQISAMLLSTLRSDAEAHFGSEVRRAVLTVPAAFTDAQRQATREAAEIAGLEVLRLVNEPTAAAMAYGLATGFKGNVVVFDLGGGTFDVSILNVNDGVFEVVATGGDPFFGGEDFDNVLVQWLQSHITEPGTRERLAHDRRATQRLKALAEQAKKAISTTERARISAELIPATAALPGVNIETMLTRDFFERLVRAKTQHCLSIVERTMKEASLDARQIDSVLLVGGMTRVPLLRRMVLEHFGKVPENAVNPDEAVAIGAAMHAAELVEKSGRTLLLDVVGSSLGVGITGGLVKPLIRKNTMLPCKTMEVFYPGRDHQVQVRVPVVQGESRLVSDNVVLGELLLGDLEVSYRSETPIEVTFALNQEGILSVSAVDQRSGKSQTVEVNARPVLLPPELERRTQSEKLNRTEVASVDSAEREQNRHARRTLHNVVAELHGMHDEVIRAAAASDDPESKEIAERLGRKLVEAHEVENSGSPSQVLAMAQSLVEILSLVVAPVPPAFEAMPEPFAPAVSEPEAAPAPTLAEPAYIDLLAPETASHPQASTSAEAAYIDLLATEAHQPAPAPVVEEPVASSPFHEDEGRGAEAFGRPELESDHDNEGRGAEARSRPELASDHEAPVHAEVTRVVSVADVAPAAVDVLMPDTPQAVHEEVTRVVAAEVPPHQAPSLDELISGSRPAAPRVDDAPEPQTSTAWDDPVFSLDTKPMPVAEVAEVTAVTAISEIAPVVVLASAQSVPDEWNDPVFAGAQPNVVEAVVEARVETHVENRVDTETPVPSVAELTVVSAIPAELAAHEQVTVIRASPFHDPDSTEETAAQAPMSVSS